MRRSIDDYPFDPADYPPAYEDIHLHNIPMLQNWFLGMRLCKNECTAMNMAKVSANISIIPIRMSEILLV